MILFVTRTTVKELIIYPVIRLDSSNVFVIDVVWFLSHLLCEHFQYVVEPHAGATHTNIVNLTCIWLYIYSWKRIYIMNCNDHSGSINR